MKYVNNLDYVIIYSPTHLPLQPVLLSDLLIHHKAVQWCRRLHQHWGWKVPVSQLTVVSLEALFLHVPVHIAS